MRSREQLRENGGKLSSQFPVIYIKEAMTAYNKAVRMARKEYFSKIITENAGNSRVLISTIDQLLNTAPPTPPQSSPAECEELALLYNNKITSNRAAGVNTDDLSKHCNVTMGRFTCIT